MSAPIVSFLGTLAGLALLLAGGAALVRGATQVAAALRISPLIVGLTVVAFGTSAPELFVNVSGALEGQTALAFGNVIGSNIANLALVLGAAALVHPITLHGSILLRELPLYLLGAATLLVLVSDRALQGSPDRLDTGDALVLLLLFAVFLYLTTRNLVRERSEALLAEVQSTALLPPSQPSWLGAPLALAGVALLYLGGELTVNNATALAHLLGVDQNLVGLLLVAVGTSLPELVTSVIAARRRESDLALGNVVGSNLFNGLFVLPVTALVRPIPVPGGGNLDVVLSFLLGLLLLPVFLVGRARMGRLVGAAFLSGYAGYAVWRVATG